MSEDEEEAEKRTGGNGMEERQGKGRVIRLDGWVRGPGKRRHLVNLPCSYPLYIGLFLPRTYDLRLGEMFTLPSVV
jgi:hypothetical protein